MIRHAPWHEISLEEPPNADGAMLLTLRRQQVGLRGVEDSAQAARSLRLQAAFMADWSAGPSNWMPRDLSLRPPLAFTNHAMRADACDHSSEQEARRRQRPRSGVDSNAHAHRPGFRIVLHACVQVVCECAWPTRWRRRRRHRRQCRGGGCLHDHADGSLSFEQLKSTLYSEQQAVLGEGDGRESSPPAHARTSSSSALRTQVPALGPDQTKPCTALHTTAPLRLRLRLGGTARRRGVVDDAPGEMARDRAAPIEAGGALGTVRLSVELKGMPGVQPLTLLVGARVGEAGGRPLRVRIAAHLPKPHVAQPTAPSGWPPRPMRGVALVQSEAKAPSHGGGSPFSMSAGAVKGQICVYRPRRQRSSVQSPRPTVNGLTRRSSVTSSTPQKRDKAATTIALAFRGMARRKTSAAADAAVAAAAALSQTGGPPPPSPLLITAPTTCCRSTHTRRGAARRHRLNQSIPRQRTPRCERRRRRRHHHQGAAASGVGGFIAAGTTMVEVRDWLQLKNGSEMELEWRALPDGGPKSLPPGKVTPLWWRSAETARTSRLVQVRTRASPTSPWSIWSAPIDAAEATGCELKLRDEHTLQELPRLQLVVSSMQGATRLLTIRAMSERTPRPCVVNDPIT